MKTNSVIFPLFFPRWDFLNFSFIQFSLTKKTLPSIIYVFSLANWLSIVSRRLKMFWFDKWIQFMFCLRAFVGDIKNFVYGRRQTFFCLSVFINVYPETGSIRKEYARNSYTYRSFGDVIEPLEDLEYRCFATTAAPNNGNFLARFYCKTDVAQNLSQKESVNYHFISTRSK